LQTEHGCGDLDQPGQVGELLREQLDHVVERQDALEASAVVDDRQAANAVRLHLLEGVVQGLAFGRRDEIAAHQFDDREIRPPNQAVHRQGDVAIGEDGDGHARVIGLADHDHVAHVVLAHRPLTPRAAPGWA